VAVAGSKTIDNISFGLEGPLKSKKIDFIEAAVEKIDPEASQVHTPTENFAYDYLVVATGHRSANECELPGASLRIPV
jgi:sulfide:quinone oxidoreductase